MAKAHVEGSLGRLVVELADDADSDVVLDEVRETVVAIAADLTSSRVGIGTSFRAIRRPG